MLDNLLVLGRPDQSAALRARWGDGFFPSDALSLKTETGTLRDGALLCAFTGTLYRRADAALPQTDDAAYLLAAWRRYGEDFLNRLEGKFILAIADLEAGRLFFARDHFGGLPLFYCLGDGFAAVSGRLSPLANAGLVPKALSRAGLCDYFSLRYIPAPDTIFEGIRALLPGHCVSARLEGGRVIADERCWWDVDCRSENMDYNYERCKNDLREAVLRAVEERLFPGANGVFLSGGIDSTIVTGAAATLLGRQIDTFTIGFHEEAFDESPRAKIAAEAHHTNHHVYTLDYNEALEELDTIIGGFDQPFADDSAVPTWVINRFAASQGVQNVLTGDGSDQIFAGSNKYFIRHYVDKLMRVPAPVRALARAAVFALPDSSARMRKIRKVMNCADMTPYEMRRRMLQLCLGDEELGYLLMGKTVDREQDTVARIYRVNRDVTDELTNTLYVDLKLMVDGCMMAKMGSMSRLAGVNTHAPLASMAVLREAFRIPPEFKQKGGSGKLILKDAFADVIPPALMTASKKGFMPPVAAWFRGPLLDDLKKELDPARMEAIGLFDPELVTLLIREHVSRKNDRAVVLWALYVFSKWYRREFE